MSLINVLTAWDFVGLVAKVFIFVAIVFFIYTIATGNSYLYYRFKDLSKGEEKTLDLASELEKKEKELKRLEEQITEIEHIERENKVVKATNDNLQGLASSITEEINSKLKELSNIKLKINENEALKEFIEKKKLTEADELDSKIKEKEEELNTLNEKINKIKKEATLSDLDEALEKKFESLFELNSIQQKIDRKKFELDKSKNNNSNAYIDFQETPDTLKNHFNKIIPETNYLDEIDVLYDFSSYLKSEGIIFNDRIIKAFHTSLKVQDVNPIAVLAGVSGTGKTLLPTAYAKFFGMYAEHVAVQPRWDSIDDLLGFYNFLESKYKATDLVRSLFFFSKEASEKNTDKLLLVLLDEMNLARIEYYFSEFLSRLELRSINKEKAKINISKDINFSIGNNVLFVGTMNEDESTFSLSDKVLDRSNVLHFGAPKADSLNKRGENNSRHGSFTTKYNLTFKNFENWRNQESYVSSSDINECKDQITYINDALKAIGKGFGYRVRNSIDAYLLRYPDRSSIKNAFADQIEMKIVPKLRGLQIDDDSNKRCFDVISTAIDYTKDEALKEAFAKARETDFGMFMWHGVDR